jgi:hypothetical protein
VKKKASASSSKKKMKTPWQDQAYTFVSGLFKDTKKRKEFLQKVLQTLEVFPEHRIRILLNVLQKALASTKKKLLKAKDRGLKERSLIVLHSFQESFRKLKPEEREALFGLALSIVVLVVASRIPFLSRARRLIA